MVHDQQTARTQRLSLYLADNANRICFWHYHHYLNIITHSSIGGQLWVSHVSTSSLLCVAAVLRTRVRSWVLSKRPPKPEWNMNISVFMHHPARCMQLVYQAAPQESTILRSNLPSLKPFETTLTRTSGFLLIVSVSLCFCGPVCGQWQWKRWKLIYSLSKSFWLYQTNHQISAVPEKNMWLWISPTMMRWALIKKDHYMTSPLPIWTYLTLLYTIEIYKYYKMSYFLLWASIGMLFDFSELYFCSSHKISTLQDRHKV